MSSKLFARVDVVKRFRSVSAKPNRASSWSCPPIAYTWLERPEGYEELTVVNLNKDTSNNAADNLKFETVADLRNGSRQGDVSIS